MEIFPASKEELCIRAEFFGDEIDHIREANYLTGEVLKERKHFAIFPASRFVTREEKLKVVIGCVEKELEERLKELRDENKLLEAQRLGQHTNYDLEAMREMGFYSGIKNYSVHLILRPLDSTPYTLLGYFGDDWLAVVDESYVALPQVRGMYNGDRVCKQVLVNHRSRLPSILDNRSLKFEEFEERTKQLVYVSAAPEPYEIEHTDKMVEQTICSAGLLDPKVEVRPIENQIDDLLSEIQARVERNERVPVTTLTKKMSEDLTTYTKEAGTKVNYLHPEIETLEQTEIIRDLRMGTYDIIVSISLLGKGTDIPEASLVVMLDADKEEFLRSGRLLIQTIGRVVRNDKSEVIVYADKTTNSMRYAADEIQRRREIQMRHNEEHGITPKTINKKIYDLISTTAENGESSDKARAVILKKMTGEGRQKTIDNIEKEMKQVAKDLDFGKATELRDMLFGLKAEG